MLAWVWNTESDRTYVSCSRMFAWTCVSFLETEITWNFILNPIDVFRRQRDRITQCYLSSIDIEFGLLMGDGLIFTSLSLIGPCKHQWSLFTRPYQQYVCCRVQVSVCEPLESVSTSCTVPTIEPRIRPLSVSLHVSTHFAKAEVTRFLSLELVHLNFFWNSFFIPTPRDGAQPFIWSFLDQSPSWRMQSFPYFSSTLFRKRSSLFFLLQ